jgi:hypothetical protein
VQPELTKGDVLHLAIGGVVLDPLLVVAVAAAWMQNRGVLVRHLGELVETASHEITQATEMGLQVTAQVGTEIEP